MHLQAQLHQQSLGATNNISQRYAVLPNDLVQSLPENHQQQSQGKHYFKRILFVVVVVFLRFFIFLIYLVL
jgi:hypothetical protein